MGLDRFGVLHCIDGSWLLILRQLLIRLAALTCQE